MVGDWWPDWQGECVAIIACGPSVENADIKALRNRIHVIAIKEAINVCPWADMVYGCDPAWWIHRKGLPEFKGIKLSHDVAVCRSFGLRHIEINIVYRKSGIVDHHASDVLLFEPRGKIGSGGNSGFQALNLAVQFGATGILLIGFDMQDRSGVHWYGRNNWMSANNPDGYLFERWKRAFNAASPRLKACEIDVVNASPISDLKCFRRCTIEQALTGWGL